MKEILSMLKDLLMQNPGNGIGLSQFKAIEVEIKSTPSINNKEVKLSDLMRKA